MKEIKVRPIEIARYYEEEKYTIIEKFNQIMEKGNFILGEEVENFEKEFAQYCNAKYCVSVGNGLDAITVLLMALGVRPNDEIIVPSNTFIATWLAVTRLGAVPVPVDAEEENFNIDPNLIEAKITPKTKGVIGVDLYGLPFKAVLLKEICDKHNIFLIDDAAQSHGAMIGNKRVGAHVLASAFSFYPVKNLGAFGDGGAVITDELELANRIRIIRNYGSSKKYIHKELGINSRLDELQAGFLRISLTKLDKWLETRRRIVNAYSGAFSSLDIMVPREGKSERSSWHLYVIRLKQRDALMNYLTKKGVQTIIHYPIPPHLQSAYKHLNYKKGDFPITEMLCNEVLSLPLHPYMKKEEVEYVIDQVINFETERKLIH